jgi:hypothetical protein
MTENKKDVLTGWRWKVAIVDEIAGWIKSLRHSVAV